MDDDVQREDLICPKCGAEDVYFQRCTALDCDDGQVSLYEEDPINFGPDETERCQMCKGRGLLRWCAKCGADLTTHHFAEFDQPEQG